MSGKSLYEMFAVMAVMAQTGYVCTARLQMLPYDAISHTHWNSSDDISGGKSTFMVEMVEANDALTYATENSLILFDEIGRGTATYDGLALAQAMIEYVHTQIKAQMMFSNSLHEVTEIVSMTHQLTYTLKASNKKIHMVLHPS